MHGDGDGDGGIGVALHPHRNGSLHPACNAATGDQREGRRKHEHRQFGKKGNRGMNAQPVCERVWGECVASAGAGLARAVHMVGRWGGWMSSVDEVLRGSV